MNEPEDKKQDVIVRLSMAVVYLSIMILILLAVVLRLWFYVPSSSTIKEEPLFCGNAPVEMPKNSYSPTFGMDGNKIFKQNCAVCHSMSSNVISGPGLENIQYRIPGGDWLHNYIANADSLYKIKDPYTLKLRQAFPKEGDRKPPFGKMLSYYEIEAVIEYIQARPVVTILP